MPEIYKKTLPTVSHQPDQLRTALALVSQDAEQRRAEDSPKLGQRKGETERKEMPCLLPEVLSQ